MEFNSLPLLHFINSIHQFFSKLSSLCSHPLFSIYVTLCTLMLLYAPSFFLSIVLSPIFNSTAIILISLLMLGANQTSGNELIVQESKYHNSIAKRSEKESDYLEPRVLDHKNNQYKRGSIDDLDLVQELSSLETRFLDFVDQTTHVECKAIEDSCHEYTQNHANSKPISSYSDQQSNQMHVEFDHHLSESISHDDYHKWEFLDTNSMDSSQVNEEEEETRKEHVSKRVDTTMKLLEWNMKAPLEVIYEAYEGEEEDDQESNEHRKISSDKNVVRSCERYPSLSMYYAESETDSSSEYDDFSMNENWETQESVLFKWEDEYEDEDREELIEISLDRYGKRSNEFCQVEEDNLIEIDIFPTRN